MADEKKPMTVAERRAAELEAFRAVGGAYLEALPPHVKEEDVFEMYLKIKQAAERVHRRARSEPELREPRRQIAEVADLLRRKWC